MPAALSLEELVRTGTFRTSRHAELLETAPALPWPALAELQSEYNATSHELERAVGGEVERLIGKQAGDIDLAQVGDLE